RLILVGKQAGSPAEHLLQRAPDTLRAVEVEDMRELVRGDEAQPAVVKQEAVVARRRRGENRDAARGKHGGEAVGRVDIVAQGEIHDAARWVQLPGEQGVRPLRLARLQQRHIAIRGPEVDAEVGGVEGAPGAGGIHLSGGARGQKEEQENADCGLRIAESQWNVDRATPFGRANPQSEIRNPQCHGSVARWRRKSSIPRVIPRAYRSCPSSLASIASCSGSMMNSPSVSAAGVQVGRTRA